jgi:hypothetical protein
MDLLEAMDEVMKLDEQLVSVDAEGRTVLKLTSPIKDDTGPVAALTFRRMTAADLLSNERFTTEQTKAQNLLSRLTGLSIAAINTMDAYDFNQANKVTGNFLMKPRRTGGAS